MVLDCFLLFISGELLVGETTISAPNCLNDKIDILAAASGVKFVSLAPNKRGGARR